MTTTQARPPAVGPARPAGPAGSRRGPGAWATRWLAALRLARRDAQRHRARTAVVLAMIGLPVAAAVFLGSLLISSFGTPLSRVEQRIGPTAQAVVRDANCGGCVYLQAPDGSAAGWLEEGDEEVSAAEVLAALEGLDVHPVSSGSVSLGRGERNLGRWEVLAYPADQSGQVTRMLEGRAPTADGEIALPGSAAERLGAEIGDSISLEASSGASVEMTLVGILDPRFAGDPMTVAGAAAQSVGITPGERWIVLGDEAVTWQHVLTVNAIGVEVISRAVALDPPPPSEVPFNAEFGMTTSSPASGTGVALGAVVILIAVIEAVLLVGPAFAVGARRQVRSLALVAAAGGSRRDLRRIVLSTGVVAGLAAGVIGAVVGVAALGVVWVSTRSNSFPLAAFLVPWWVPAGGIAFAVGLGALASWMPARTASRIDVVSALAGRRADLAPRARVPWIGVGLMVAGLVGAVVGALAAQTLLLLGGVLALEVGAVLATGGLLTLVARLAPRLGVAGRFALRDAVRSRSRTVPAVASVLAAVAGVTAAAVYVASDEAAQQTAWRPSAAVGAVIAASDLTDPMTPADLEALRAEVDAVTPVTGWAPIHGLGRADEAHLDPADLVDGTSTSYGLYVDVQPRPQDQCPNLQGLPVEADDPRCFGVSGSIAWSGFTTAWNVLVDDGTAVALFGFDGAAQAAQALRAGTVLVQREELLWDDGTVHLQLELFQEEGEAESLTIIAPGQVAPWLAYEAVLPSELVAEHPELTPVLIGAVGVTSEPWTQALADRVQAVDQQVSLQGPYRGVADITLLALLGVAALVALGATWLSVGLAAAETRPDLSTLAAVGASPGFRRRVAGSQAAVIAVLGVGLGALLGLALGWVLARWRVPSGYYGQIVMTLTGEVPGVVVPWLTVVAIAVGLPGLAVAGAWVTAPRRLPMVARVS